MLLTTYVYTTPHNTDVGSLFHALDGVCVCVCVCVSAIAEEGSEIRESVFSYLECILRCFRSQNSEVATIICRKYSCRTSHHIQVICRFASTDSSTLLRVRARVRARVRVRRAI